jgi:hypothetical protein
LVRVSRLPFDDSERLLLNGSLLPRPKKQKLKKKKNKKTRKKMEKKSTTTKSPGDGR